MFYNERLMLPSELALIALLIVVSARKLSSAQHFPKVIHSVAERKREESREKEARVFDFAQSRDWFRSFYPKVVAVRFPRVKMRLKTRRITWLNCITECGRGPIGYYYY